MHLPGTVTQYSLKSLRSKEKEIVTLVILVFTISFTPLNCHPRSDIYLRAAQLFEGGPEAADCLAFEDAPSGVASAAAAGMQVRGNREREVPRLRESRFLTPSDPERAISRNLFNPVQAWTPI